MTFCLKASGKECLLLIMWPGLTLYFHELTLAEGATPDFAFRAFLLDFIVHVLRPLFELGRRKPVFMQSVIDGLDFYRAQSNNLIAAKDANILASRCALEPRGQIGSRIRCR